VRYLTGFTGSNGAVLIWESGSLLYTDPRYAIQASEESDCKAKVARGQLLPEALRTIARKRFKRIGFERDRISYDTYLRLQEGLVLGASLTPVTGWVEQLRAVKSAEEIEAIRKSVITNSRAFDCTIRKVKPGMPESDLACEIEYQMRKLGAQKPAFDTIVASGTRTALPHAQPSSQPILGNQLLLVDMGASRDGYSSDMTRMAFPGRPGRLVRERYKAVLDAQLAAISAVREGVTAEQVDRKARQVLRAAGLEKAFVHSTGHGLGLEIHEIPRVGKRDKTVLAAGMAITIEPGVYLEGFGGIRIEDTVVVTRNGCEILTPTPKDLLVL
jgi:Xaa-Pro aminopeptidase